MEDSMIDAKWHQSMSLISIPREVFSETSIGYEYLLCSVMNIMEILMYVFFFDETISQMEILRKLGMECSCIWNVSSLTDIGDRESYRSLRHDVDRIRTDISDQPKYTSRECE